MHTTIPNSNLPSQLYANRSGYTDTLRQHPLRHIMTIIVLLWIAYAATNFRSPLTPIIVSDSNASSAVRQLIFGGAGLSAIGLLFLTRNIGAVIALNLPLSVLAGFVALSTLWSPEPALSAKRAILYVFCFATLITLVHSSKQPVRKMLQTIVYATTAIACVSLLMYFALPEIYSVNLGRPGLSGVAVHPNTLSPFLSIGLILSLGIFAQNSREWFMLRASQASLAFALLLTYSITTWLTTALAFSFYTFLSARTYRRGIIQLLIVGTLLLGTSIGWKNIQAAAFETTGRDASLSGRDALWSIVFNEGKQHPVFGKGYGAFWTEGKGRELVQTWNPRQSHNAYLDVWLDLGILGLIGVGLCFHVALFTHWSRVRGDIGSPRRRAMAALYAAAFGYMLSYAFAQSFLLRFDSFPFLVLTWSTLLITNRDHNGINQEFPILS
jgi:exopolysaccharide production protein ExoQ